MRTVVTVNIGKRGDGARPSKRTYAEEECAGLVGRPLAICLGETQHSPAERAAILATVRGQSVQPAARCVHLGQLVRVGTCDLCSLKGQPFDVFACGLHGECSKTRKHTKVKSCAACEDWRAGELQGD